MLKSKYLWSSNAVLATFLTFSPAMAATTVVDGSCISVTDNSGCLFNGNINSNNNGNNSYTNAQNAYNLYNDTHPSANPDIALTILASSDDGNFGSFGSLTGAGTSGTWNLPGYLVDFLAVKASNNFVLYELASPMSSGSWDTLDIPFNNNAHDISHLVFFGTQDAGAVPEPATWAFMIFGFGAIGGTMRRRKAQVKVSYA